MRLLIILTINLSWLTCFSQSIEKHFAPEVKDNVIILETYGSDSAAFANITSVLRDHGWYIENLDASRHSVQTKARTINSSNGGVKATLNLRKIATNPTVFYLEGFFDMSTSGFTVVGGYSSAQTTEPISFVGGKNSAYKKTFSEMQSVAKACQANVYYGYK